MEPFKALTLLAAAGIVSLVGVGAVGFYAGYSAGRGNLDEIKSYLTETTAVIPSGNGGTVSLKPVLDGIQALSKQIDAQAGAKTHAASDEDSGAKPVLEEVRALSKQIEALSQVKTHSSSDDETAIKPVLDQIKLLAGRVDSLASARPRSASDDEAVVKPVLEQIKALSRQIDGLAPAKARGASDGDTGGKPVLEEIKALSRQVEALSSSKTRSSWEVELSAKPVLDEIRGLSKQIEALKAEGLKSAAAPVAIDRPAPPPAPDYTETLSDIREQIKSLALKVEKQEPSARRAVAEEVRTAVAALQAAEPKAPKALLEEVRNLSAVVAATARAQDARPQASVIDQIKVLQATIENLKAKVSEAAERGRGEGASNADVAQIRQLLAAASDQFGRCQTQLASFSSAGAAVTPVAPAATTVAVSQTPRQEPSAVVFYDNVMLRKDQEKQYDEIGVRLSLQSVGSRQVRVAVNRQGFGLSFGERKVFRSQDVECEINLMETNLNDAQARVSLSCKR